MIALSALAAVSVDQASDVSGKAVLKQPDQIAFQIFDQSAVGLIDPQYKTQSPVVAETLEELAGKCEINPAELSRTVREFDAAIDTSKRFDPSVKDGRAAPGLPIMKSNWATAIETAPFVVYKVISGITFTFGGVKIDRHARVLDYTNQPIPGLYATGEMTGGFFYNSYPAGRVRAYARRRDRASRGIPCCETAERINRRKQASD